MRLSLKKGAHAALSSAAWQEIRVRSGRDDKSSCTNKFVTSTGVAVSLWPTQDEKRLGSATTLYATVALSFVIPSEAEGPAVRLHAKQRPSQ